MKLQLFYEKKAFCVVFRAYSFTKVCPFAANCVLTKYSSLG